MPSQGFDIEIQKPDGTWLGLMLAVPRGEDGQPIEGKAKEEVEILAASDDELPISKRLIPRIIEDWSGGVGVSYHHASGVYTRTPGYALPAGKPTEMTLPASNASNSHITAFAVFGGSIWASQKGDGTANTARVIRSTDMGVTWTNSLNIGASQYMNDLLVFDEVTESGGIYSRTSRLYASSADANGASSNGRLHRWNGTSWTSTTIGDYTLGSSAYGRQAMRAVLWTDNEGVSEWRMVVISSGNTVSYTLPNADPMDDSATAWVEGVHIGTGVNLTILTGSRRHVFCHAQDGVFDLTELGDSIPLTSYNRELLHGANSICGTYLDGYVYNSFGQGCDRIKVDEGPILQEAIGQCAPGWGTPAESLYRGWPTAMCTSQGELVYAMHNVSSGVSGIFWGKDAKQVGVETRNPLAWWGPEVVITGSYKVTSMVPIARAEDELALFFAASKGSALSDGPPIFYRVSLPVSGAPVQDLASLGKHRFATGDGTGTVNARCELELLEEGWDDRASKKFLHEHTVVSRGLSVRDGVDDGFGTKLTFFDRADPVPGSQTWASSVDVTEWPAQTIEPDDVVEGHRIGRKIRFVSPQGAAAYPTAAKVGVLDAVRTTAWRVVPSFKVRSVTVEYGAGVVDLNNREDQRDPDDVTEALYELSSYGRTVARDRRGRRATIKVEQVVNASATYHDEPPGKTVKAQIEITRIAVLS